MSLIYLVYALNIVLCIIYAMGAYTAVQTLKRLKEFSQFHPRMLRRVAHDMYMMWVRQDKEYQPPPDGRGWAAAYTAASFFATSSSCFALLHLDYLLSGDVNLIGSVGSLLWFACHTISTVGQVNAVYSAEHAALRSRNLLNSVIIGDPLDLDH